MGVAKPQACVGLLCLAFQAGLALRLNKRDEAGPADQDFFQAQFPSFAASFSNIAAAASGGEAVRCTKAESSGNFAKPSGGASAIEGHWHEICGSWGGTKNPKHPEECSLKREAFHKEMGRLQGCGLTKLVRDDMKKAEEQFFSIGNVGLNTQLAAADGLMTPLLDRFLPTIFDALDADKDGDYTLHDFKDRCSAVGKLDLQSDAQVGRFADEEMPTKVMNDAQQMAKFLPEQLLSFMRLNKPFGIARKRRAVEAFAFLCSDCSKGLLEGWSLDGDSILDAERAHKLGQANKERGLKKKKWDALSSMWAWGYYRDDAGKQQVLPGVAAECTARSKPEVLEKSL